MRRFTLLTLAAATLLLGACTSSAAGPSGSSASSPPSSSPASSSPPPTSPASSSRPVPPTTSAPASVTTPPVSGVAARVLASMSERQRVGQLLMVDCPTSGLAAATSTAITADAAGSVILDGTTQAGIAPIRALTDQLQALAPSGVGLFIATDQEGGLVQRLQGAGFTSIVSAVQQGTIAPATLQGYAQGWGQQLKAAGVNIDLAPVFDTVPAGFGSNPPIGDLDREYGSSPDVVAAHAVAVQRGLMSAGIDVTPKHFPGLGRVRGNTDLASGVTDYVTTRDDPYLAPFRAAIAAGAPFVMMSTAIYSRLDPGTPAAFSKPIVTDLLRGTLGFRGVVISDDLGAAKQVSGYSWGQRAVSFVAAGGDVVLTVSAEAAAPMADALLQRAGADPAFKQLVDAAALRVLQAKAALGLLH